MTTPRVYAACLAAYSNGKLHGAWIDCTSEDEVQAEIQAMLKASPEPDAEEWAFHGYDGFPCSLDENEDIATLVAIAEAIEEHGEAYEAALSYYTKHEDAVRACEEYCGAWDSFVAYAEDFIDSSDMLRDVPEQFHRYFDVEAFARDLEHDHITVEHNGSVHVFGIW